MKTFTIGQKLRNTVHIQSAQLLKMEATFYSTPLALGKWSPKQIMGHLIDSCANNHQRFVRAQIQDNLVFPGYQQEEWVVLQDYQNQDWEAIITLWKNYNLHLAKVIEKIPETILFKEHLDHVLDKIAYKTIPADQPATLAYFIEDYLNHMNHHLKQIGLG